MTTRIETSLPAQLERIEKARAARGRKAVLKDRHVTLSHGSGGKASRQLLDAVILPVLGNALLDGSADSAVLPLNGASAAAGERLAFTTDSYVVSPLFFPGGDIGSLAVHGTINDLAVAGARPMALSLAFIVEEGLDMDVLRRVVESVGRAADAAGVPVVTGDTKVVNRGKADGLFVNTAGVGLVPPGRALSAGSIRPGDRVLVSGRVADHGMAILLAREALELESEIESDSAPVHELVAALLDAVPATRAIRDPTRGGVATALNELAGTANVGIFVDESAIPVRSEVRGACEILGIDPLHIANEGRIIAVVPADGADAALESMRSHPLGRDAAVIGEVRPDAAGMVVARTGVGGSRVLDMLVGDALPRIC